MVHGMDTNQARRRRRTDHLLLWCGVALVCAGLAALARGVTLLAAC
jgi:hypothetical protein